MYTLAIDTGKHLAAALLKKDRLIDVYYQHEECFEKSDVQGLAKRLWDQMICSNEVPRSKLTVVIELPSHRYFGRGNSTPLLKAFWQGIRLFMALSGKVGRIVYVPADQWNKQRGDKEKKRVFDLQFPNAGTLRYYQDKHGGRSNAHERDAALIGLWLYNRQKIEKRVVKEL